MHTRATGFETLGTRALAVTVLFMFSQSFYGADYRVVRFAFLTGIRFAVPYQAVPAQISCFSSAWASACHALPGNAERFRNPW